MLLDSLKVSAGEAASSVAIKQKYALYERPPVSIAVSDLFDIEVIVEDTAVEIVSTKRPLATDERPDVSEGRTVFSLTASEPPLRLFKGLHIFHLILIASLSEGMFDDDFNSPAKWMPGIELAQPPSTISLFKRADKLPYALLLGS